MNPIKRKDETGSLNVSARTRKAIRYVERNIPHSIVETSAAYDVSIFLILGKLVPTAVSSLKDGRLPSGDHCGKKKVYKLSTL
ncbi:hypothetical protein LCGC14_0701940 [marine sediment metagenome]|uniref:Uncharacterized protein n=1 Tax=marine sediment metagenome TaxID=412755 RepID=A0A0F9R2X3_9ZZZZ